MDKQTEKRIRFNSLKYILHSTGLQSVDPEFSKWISGIMNNHDKEKFEELYKEIDDFTKSNYDIIQLSLIIRNQNLPIE